MQAKFLIMNDKIRIENYKSIVDLTLELGRFNVIIGTNGCGKSNILEAITEQVSLFCPRFSVTL